MYLPLMSTIFLRFFLLFEIFFYSYPQVMGKNIFWRGILIMIMVWERKMDYEKDSFWRLTHTMMETILWLYHTLEDLNCERLKGKKKENICCILSYICICLWFYPTINIWPIDSIFDVKLFNSFSLSTDVLYFLAMEYRESPFCTVYVVSSGVLDGINRTWPMDKRLLVRLFNSFSSSIVTLYFLAMEYKESPFFTV